MRYCKGCGDDLLGSNSLAEPPVKVVRTTGAAFAVAIATIAITLAGLAITFGFASELLRPIYGGIQQPNSHIPVALLMVAFGSATVFSVVFMLIKLFTKLMHLPEDASRKDKKGVPMLPDYRPNQIPSAPQPFSSVTEHTTRNFERANNPERDRAYEWKGE